MSEESIGGASLIVLVFLFVGIGMTFGTKLYLNRSKRRDRYIELVFGTDNDWYKGRRFDFLMAHLLGAPAILTAWRMRVGFVTEKQKSMGAYAYPMLHRNFNYLKLLNEFRLFALWEALKIVFLIAGVLGMLVVYGFSDGWW